MAIGSVDQGPRRGEANLDNLMCKCEQVSGVLATIAQSEASHDEIKNAIWGALALAHEAQDMAEAVLNSDLKEA